MALNIDQIRNYNRGGSLLISDADGNEPAQIKKTSFWHWVKCRFGNDRAEKKPDDT